MPSLRVKPSFALPASSLALLALTLVPMWGIRVPLLVDLPEQLAVAKLFAEKLSGESALNIEIPPYVGYRFFPVLAAATLRLFGLLGINVAYLPTALTAVLVLLNGVVLLHVIRRWAEPGRLEWTWSLALLPMLTVYSSSFYVGLVNYFPAVPFLILAISFAEKWFESGRATELAGFFIALCLVYICHPFAFFFWVAWAVCRLLVLAAVRGDPRWARIAALAATTCVVVAYHLTQTPPAMRVDKGIAFSPQIVVSLREWLGDRIGPLATGDFFALASNFASRLYGLSLAALALGSFAHVLATRSFVRTSAQLLLTALLFYVVCSLPNEAAIPVPPVAMLFYDVRFASAAPAVLMTFVCVYILGVQPLRSARRRAAVLTLCALGILVCGLQLVQIHDWFTRFDAFARKSLPGIEKGGEEVQSRFPSKYHVDGTFIRHYRCLYVPNCIPSSSWFLKNNGSGLYAVTIVRSP